MSVESLAEAIFHSLWIHKTQNIYVRFGVVHSYLAGEADKHGSP